MLLRLTNQNICIFWIAGGGGDLVSQLFMSATGNRAYVRNFDITDSGRAIPGEPDQEILVAFPYVNSHGWRSWYRRDWTDADITQVQKFNQQGTYLVIGTQQREKFEYLQQHLPNTVFVVIDYRANLQPFLYKSIVTKAYAAESDKAAIASLTERQYQRIAKHNVYYEYCLHRLMRMKFVPPEMYPVARDLTLSLDDILAGRILDYLSTHTDIDTWNSEYYNQWLAKQEPRFAGTYSMHPMAYLVLGANRRQQQMMSDVKLDSLDQVFVKEYFRSAGWKYRPCSTSQELETLISENLK